MKKKYLLLMFLSILALGVTSCSKDDDDEKVMAAPTGSITVQDQALDNNTLTISNVTMSNDGWVVIHRDNGDGGPMVPDIISEPKMVQAGENSDVMIQLKDGVEVSDGETLWVMLHTDDGQIGTYEFDGSNGLDAPIVDNGNVVTKAFTVEVMSPEPTGSLTVTDQAVVDNSLTVGNITLDQAGYVVVHADNSDGGPVVPDIISEPVYLEAGSHDNVEVPLKDDANVNAGDTVWVMLHTDNGTEGEYEFDGSNGLDGPITDMNGDIVMTSIIISAAGNPMGSLSVDDQVLTNNHVSVGSISLDQAGWVVIHADNGNDGPQVPEIISQPVYLQAGDYTNVEVPLKESADVNTGDTVWVMLHTDTGTAGEYEFDGSGNGIDSPIKDENGDIVVTPVNITDVTTSDITGSITVNDQALTDGKLSVGSITLDEAGWVVVHADNGDGAPQVPEIISEPVYLDAGTTDNVEISFKDSSNVSVGDTVWVMLHNDTGVQQEYEFNGTNGLDLPITDANGDVVVMPVVIVE
ncbi:MAG: hypothetical protein WCE57_07205 [Salegentibacter sp.]